MEQPVQKWRYATLVIKKNNKVRLRIAGQLKNAARDILLGAYSAKVCSDALDRLGKDGWELVTSVQVAEETLLCFKQEIPEEPRS